MDRDTRPRLRWPLDIEHLEYQGQKLLVLRDKQEVAPEPAIIPREFLPILARFDGEHSIASIAQEGAHVGLTEDLILTFAHELEQLSFLDNEATTRRYLGLIAEFEAQQVREPALAGLVYPAEAESLKQTIDTYLQAAEVRYRPEAGDIAAIMCPHIDYQRGWQSYASAYSALETAEKPDVIFLIGTSHYGGETTFQFSKKDFSTPLGTFSAARDIISSIAKKLGEKRCFQDEYLHKREHSLELQLPFIAHCFQKTVFPQIVPILLGSFHEFLLSGQYPESRSEIEDTFGVLAEALRQVRISGKRALFYAGVDLAHVGLHFGDSRRISDGGLDEIRQRDEILIRCVLETNEKKLFSHMAEDLDRRRICGFPSLYSMLAILRRAGITTRGHCIDYRQAVDSQSDCIVTFASACWREPSSTTSIT